MENETKVGGEELYIYIYIYMCVCVYVCMYIGEEKDKNKDIAMLLGMLTCSSPQMHVGSQ